MLVLRVVVLLAAATSAALLTALPPSVEREVLTAVRRQSNCTVRILATMKNIIEVGPLPCTI